ncbi:MAG: hypothetical protein JJ992_28250 [Planctomycetes bacterium]|nr:hypothetical protein [Planctomycetota bacterium]
MMPAWNPNRFVPIAALILLGGFPSLGVRAETLQVQFDAYPAVGCRDVTPPEFASSNPDERMVEAAFEVSSLIHHGSEDNLLQYLYRLESRQPSVSIADYSPKTTLASNQAGPVAIERKTETNNHAGLAVTGPLDWPAKVTGSGDIGTKSQDSSRFELVPEMIPVTASGTIQRGQGVYFKLKPSRSDTLEGSRQFKVTFRVPGSWRGGYVQLTCTALGVDRGVVRPFDEQIICGNRRFVIALYLEGDAQAKAAAQRLVRAESELWRTVVSRQEEIERRSRPTFVHKVGVLFDAVRPLIPEDWTHQLVFGPHHEPMGKVADRLPPDVQEAVAEYELARRELRTLGDGQATDVQ